jgi:hypothetical protein
MSMNLETIHPDTGRAMDGSPRDLQHNIGQLIDDDGLQVIEPHSHHEESYWGRLERKLGHIPRTVIACLVMLLAGTMLIATPSLTTVSGSTRIGMYVMGSLLLIPSVYVAYILYHVVRETPGFTLDGLPLWDDIT